MRTCNARQIDQAPFREYHEQDASRHYSDGLVRSGHDGAHDRVLARAALVSKKRLSMCDKCDELEKKIEHYRSITTRITDQKTIEGLKALIEACLAQRAALHPDRKGQPLH
jgi:hypothetical protein